MTLQDEMAANHGRDYAEKFRMTQIVMAIEGFLLNTPSNCHTRTREKLQAAAQSLRDDCAAIVRRYD